jgi:hypothetical protein
MFDVNLSFPFDSFPGTNCGWESQRFARNYYFAAVTCQLIVRMSLSLPGRLTRTTCAAKSATKLWLDYSINVTPL